MRPRTIACFVATLLLIAAPRAWAQLDKLKNTTPEERAKAQTELMKSKLDLTADQLPKVADLNLKYAQKMEPILKGDAGWFMKMHEVKEISGAKEAELKQILSPEQFDKYLASKAEMRERFEEEFGKKSKGR